MVKPFMLWWSRLVADEISHVYLRLSANARHSQIDFDEIEGLADNAELHHDGKDYLLYSLALPGDLQPADANRIISALVTKPYIDEAWTDSKVTAEIKPPSNPNQGPQ